MSCHSVVQRLLSRNIDRFLKRKPPQSDTSESKPLTSSSSGRSVKEVDTTSKMKKRQYDDDYLMFGFIFTGELSCPLPLCLLCGMKFSNHAMVPSKFKRHLTTNHPSDANQIREYFFRLKSEHSWQEQVMFKCAQVSKNALEASYLVAKINNS